MKPENNETKIKLKIDNMKVQFAKNKPQNEETNIDTTSNNYTENNNFQINSENALNNPNIQKSLDNTNKLFPHQQLELNIFKEINRINKSNNNKITRNIRYE